jgi:lipoprotein NlpD
VIKVKVGLTNFRCSLPYMLGCALAISGCGTPVIPVLERDTLSVQEEVELMGGSVIRITQSGDTLYSLAFEAGIDFRELAQWNRIAEPYTITVGQKVRLTKPVGFTVASSSSGTNQGNNDGASRIEPRVSSRSVGSSGSSSTQSKSTSRTTVSMGPGAPDSWLWPVAGPVIGSYNPAVGRKGIDIAGAEGSIIKATAGGRVVYSGTGLRGYGEMLILKHSDDYLSAYAHNRRILVTEGETVTQGQKIAELGNSGTDKFMLHFEIRRQGQPVDPRQYLPGAPST